MEQDQKAVEQQAQAPVAEQQREDQGKESPNAGNLIAESKKYRTRAQESESLVQELQNQLKEIEDKQLAEKEDYKTLAEKREKENAELKVKADIGEALEKSLRADALESMPEEDREFAEEMSTEKLLKFAKRSVKVLVSTNESAIGVTVPPDKNPFTEMTPDERRKNWGRIVEGYRNKSKN